MNPQEQKQKLQQNKMLLSNRKLLEFQDEIKNDQKSSSYITTIWKLTNEELTLAQHVVKWYFIIAILKFTLEIILYLIQIITLMIPIFKMISRLIYHSFLGVVI